MTRASIFIIFKSTCCSTDSLKYFMKLYIKSAEMSTLNMKTFAKKKKKHHSQCFLSSKWQISQNIVTSLELLLVWTFAHVDKNPQGDQTCKILWLLHNKTCPNTHSAHPHTCRVLYDTATKYFVTSKTIKGWENKVTYSLVPLLHEN